ncbi:MAG: ABC transporter ATP-binding protein [Clostridiales bacterium]|nr:ABC transporter ATP-binding protein [Clostridiales bacterium]
MELLKIKNVEKSFDAKKVIDGVSFTVESGKIVGLLGKNGCGKTTIIKMINDLLTVDKGEILIDGKKVGVESKKIISYLPERSYLEGNERVIDVINLFKDFYEDFDEEKAVSLLKDLDLDANQKLPKMSKGMKEKLQLVLVMSRKAKLYVLDEPLGGVDPVSRERILKTILSNFDEGSSLLITTHLIADVEKILDEIVLIDNGKVVLEGSAEELREKENSSIDEIFRRIVK